ncbi:hypothetical protein FHX82_003769 [Amycolatopsis bartoniae]|nr:hypothetical protein [Amycolatopsis bartoniae]MBB2936705.1 hypothetical protein [Amycolatopsis bartoniae]
MSGVEVNPDSHQESIAGLGAVLGGRRGYDAVAERHPGKAGEQPYGGAWRGPVFVLTHHPEDARAVVRLPRHRAGPVGPRPRR